MAVLLRCARVWFVPILLVHFLTSLTHLTPSPGSPVSPSPHSAGQPQAQKVSSIQTDRHSHSGLKSAIPAEALTPPLHEPLQARDMGRPFSRDWESSIL